VSNGSNGGNTIPWTGICVTPGGASGAGGGAPGGAGGKGAGLQMPIAGLPTLPEMELIMAAVAWR